MSRETPAIEETVEVRIRRFPHAADLPLPRPATAGAAGVDLRAAIDGPRTLGPGERAMIPTGVAIALPPGWEGQIRPRSGLAWKHGIGLVNAPGTIDADFRGEIHVLLLNHGDAPWTVERADRIAQLVVQRVPTAHWVEADELPASSRGDGGFGHTGTR